ncbi:MAG: hypothetical protein ABI813_10420, partial [Bacteroidota bacterium]
MQTMESSLSLAGTITHHFKFYNRNSVLSLTRIRRFETKLGKRVGVVHDKQPLEESLQHSTAQYVLFGVPEDIGVKAN